MATFLDIIFVRFIPVEQTGCNHGLFLLYDIQHSILRIYHNLFTHACVMESGLFPVWAVVNIVSVNIPAHAFW